jgi:RHS repeat-associated protein
MITRGSGEIAWTSYDLPSRIDDLSDSSYTEFRYGPDRSRIQQYQSDRGATITYAGLLFEFEDAGTDTYRHYVQAGDKVVAVVERVGTTNTKQFLHRDHQGSVVKVTNASGTVDQALAFDAWGLRRDASDWSALGSPFAGSHETERGYTGHEHLDTVGLIHMNGRVQDPVLGRFISADPFIQAPFNTQSHNRYSYVWNNPTSYIDPTGFHLFGFLPFIGPVCMGGHDGLDEVDEGGMIHTGLSPSEWEEMLRTFDQMDADRDTYASEVPIGGGGPGAPPQAAIPIGAVISTGGAVAVEAGAGGAGLGSSLYSASTAIARTVVSGPVGFVALMAMPLNGFGSESERCFDAPMTAGCLGAAVWNESGKGGDDDARTSLNVNAEAAVTPPGGPDDDDDYDGESRRRAARTAVQRGQGPRGITRLDRPDARFGSQWEAHTGGRGSPALRMDGTWKHVSGGQRPPQLPRATQEWLRDLGWQI